MTSTFRLNPQWFSKVNQVVEYRTSRQIQHIRNVGGRRVEPPAGYRQAWTNALGKHIVLESEDFSPNGGSNQNRQKMEKK
jgi:hypothetical protein